MNIYRRLWLGFGAVLAATSVTGLVAVLALYATIENKDKVVQAFGEDLARVENLRYRAEHVVSSSRAYLLTGDETFLVGFDDSNRAFRETLDRVQAEVGSTEAQDLEGVRQAWQEYVAVAQGAARQRSAGPITAQMVAYFDEVVQPARDTLEDRIDDLVLDERHELSNAFDASRVNALRAGSAVILTTLVGLWLSASLALATRKSLARHAAEQQEAAATANRAVADRNEVLAVVSHDLRSPLTTVGMSVNLLKRKLSGSPELSRHAETIEKAAQRMDRLIEDLVDAARIEAGGLELKREKCDVAPLVKDTLMLFEPQAEKKPLTLTSVVPEHAEAFVDRDRIGRVLANLLGNALKFTPEGGEVTVKVEPDPQFVRVSVADTGPGVRPEQVPHLFDKYWHQDKHERGLGLGLYIAKSVVDAHGGAMQVESRPGRGSTFSFWVPTEQSAHELQKMNA